MQTSIALSVDDLVRPVLSGNHTDGEWQCRLISHFHPGPTLDINAYVTADDARRIAASWSALADEITEREMAELARDDERAATVAALSPDAEATLARAFGNTRPDADPTPAHGTLRPLPALVGEA